MSKIIVNVPNAACLRRYNTVSIFLLPRDSRYPLWRFRLPNECVEKNDNGFTLSFDSDSSIQLACRGEDYEATADEVANECNTHTDYDFKEFVITIPSELENYCTEQACCIHVPNNGDVWSVIIPSVLLDKETGDYKIPETVNVIATKIDETKPIVIGSSQLNDWVTSYTQNKMEETNNGNRE